MDYRNPTVTVLMPVYNGSNYLAQAIESILNQTFTDFEFLIIDDASTDNSIVIIKSYDDPRIRLVENDYNLGQTATLNRGIKLSKGKYIARMDHDDLSLPKRLEEQVQFLEDNPNISIVGTWWKNIDENNLVLSNVRLPVEGYECGFWMFANGEPVVGHPCVMFRATEIRNLGGYNTKYEIAQDADLWFRACVNDCQFANIPEVLLLYRIHNQQASNNCQTEVEHHSALSVFLSKQLSQHIEPHVAALIRPKNFNDSYFHNEKQIDEMFLLKERALKVFFKQYKLSAVQILRCCIRLWESLFHLSKLKITNRPRMILKNTVFCYHILQNQVKQKNIVFFPYLILFIVGLQKFILKKSFRKLINIFNKLLGQRVKLILFTK